MRNVTFDDALYVVVPMEPTDQMVTRGATVIAEDIRHFKIEDIYRAMIAAAPKPEAGEVG